eukprot:COSAG01_NODE_1390_length_10496_cov_8.535116_4_plen_84_part_00
MVTGHSHVRILYLLHSSWDRLPFSVSKDVQHKDLLERNMLLSNFNSYNGLDTDDDSAYFLMRANVLLYGHMLKSDFSGHDNVR